MLKLTNISASIGICCLFYFFFFTFILPYFYFSLYISLLYFHFSKELTALMSFLYGLSPSRMLSAGSLPCLTVKRDPAKTHRNHITMINNKILYKKFYFPSSPPPPPSPLLWWFDTWNFFSTNSFRKKVFFIDTTMNRFFQSSYAASNCTCLLFLTCTISIISA